MNPKPYIACLLLSVLLLNYARGQQTPGIVIQGLVKDESTQEVIPYAHVFYKNPVTRFFAGTITDLQGKFILTVPPPGAHDTLHITSIGYTPYTVPLRALAQKKQNTILLTPQVTSLPTLVVRDVTAGELFRKCITSFRKNYLDVSFLNTAFYWQTIQEDDAFLSLQEKNLVIRENNFTNKVERFLYKNTPATRPVYYHYFDSLESLLYFDLIRSSSGVMNLSVQDEWDFRYDTDAPLAENYVGIKGLRKDKLAEVSVLMNDKLNAIEEVDFTYAWGHNQHSLNDTLLYKFTDVHGKILYNQNLTRYNLKYLFVSISYDLFQKINHKKVIHRTVVHELVINTSQESYSPPEKEHIIVENELKPTIINLDAYCEAASFLGKERDFCKSQP
jgi:hypothetical protein